MSFLERAKSVAGQAATNAARVGADVGRETAKAAGVAGDKAAATIRDPATKARASSALKKAKRGFSTALERIDPAILADVVIKATSLQERANTRLQSRGSVYRIGQIQIGASIPPSIQFAIERVDDPGRSSLVDSTTLLARAAEGKAEGDLDRAAVAAADTIVTLDGTTIDADTLEELEIED